MFWIGRARLSDCERLGAAGDYRVFKTACGWCGLARTGLGICALVLPVAAKSEAEDAIRDAARGAKSLPRSMEGIAQQVTRYFDGRRVAFRADLDFTRGSPFQRRVWEAVCAVPYGEVRTYAGVALEIGRPNAARAVGAAVAANPIPLIVPCHRIVRSDGGLGGFSAAGGVAMKRAMLELEAVPMFGDGDETRVIAG